ncbi:SPFH domain-containing protein [Desulfolutivibrio sulfoxidireducens]|uniref:SPFH domain-containing protein n=1 Tax=Desulfolutivibrio sulfoxidireducens TaxID=2773299 RepID=UPI00159DFC2D|nr:stomatin-like protein [Desulfolutivibrio sulfoxidireducens]QLA17432.1 paraslipin [Desulfolutivibrio sulfoxidireducens]
MFSDTMIMLVVLAVVVIILFVKTAVVVPQRSEFVVERLGKFHNALGAGFHILIPFLDKIAYRRSLKEEVMDIPSQTCITKDNVAVSIDGVLYLQVIDSKLSAYGIENYYVAASQLAQTSLRSAIGKISLDKTFEERENINRQVIEAVDEAAQNWGIKVLRYEIKDITPPASVMEAMERQMKAEREKRAEIATSEGDRQARINRAEGMRQEAISVSEGEKQKRINEAEGRSREIELLAQATAQGLLAVAAAVAAEGGVTAANLRVAERYLAEFGNLAKAGNTMILPANLADIAGVVATAMSVMREEKGK